ncbi:hypothetical protein REPUB_Repub15cG0087500 [Reevesia pubescens]
MKTVPQLPQDIIVNILSRLPIKYLIQLKCVCKPWRSLISDPQFAKLHLAQSKKNNIFRTHRVLVITVPLQSVACVASGDDILDYIHLDYPLIMKKSPDSDELVDADLEIGGSCNGLICVVFENGRIFLWNPTIREALELPIDSAFDPKARRANDTKKSIVIVAFHMVEEEFYELVPIPDNFEDSKHHLLVLRISGDCLCLFYGGGCYESDLLEAWLLKEYGLMSSWTRLFSVHRDIIAEYEYWENALYYTKTDKVVLDYDGRDLVWYDPKENTSKTFTPQNDWDWFQPAIYIESLVSPNS